MLQICTLKYSLIGNFWLFQVFYVEFYLIFGQGREKTHLSIEFSIFLKLPTFERFHIIFHTVVSNTSFIALSLTLKCHSVIFFPIFCQWKVEEGIHCIKCTSVCLRLSFYNFTIFWFILRYIEQYQHTYTS